MSTVRYSEGPGQGGPEPDDCVIYRYTRAQAIADGVLVDVTETAREAGYSIPVAVTAGVWGIVEAPPGLKCQDTAGRLWDVLMVLHGMIRRARRGVSRIYFPVSFLNLKDGRPVRENIRMWAHCGPGDNAEPVLTIMLENED